MEWCSVWIDLSKQDKAHECVSHLSTRKNIISISHRDHFNTFRYDSKTHRRQKKKKKEQNVGKKTLLQYASQTLKSFPFISLTIYFKNKETTLSNCKLFFSFLPPTLSYTAYYARRVYLYVESYFSSLYPLQKHLYGEKCVVCVLYVYIRLNFTISYTLWKV